MEEVVVKGSHRDMAVKPKHVREEGQIPAVLYSAGKEGVSLQLEYQEFRKAFRKTGQSTVLYIELDGKKIPTLVHDIQYEPVYDAYTHLDFYEVDESKEVTAYIPVIIEGFAPAVKTLNGVLVEPMGVVEISCLPKYLLHDIRINVSGLVKFYDAITVADLDIVNDKNITILTPLDSVLASISTPKGGTDEEATEEEDAPAVEKE